MGKAAGASALVLLVLLCPGAWAQNPSPIPKAFLIQTDSSEWCMQLALAENKFRQAFCSNTDRDQVMEWVGVGNSNDVWGQIKLAGRDACLDVNETTPQAFPHVLALPCDSTKQAQHWKFDGTVLWSQTKGAKQCVDNGGEQSRVDFYYLHGCEPPNQNQRLRLRDASPSPPTLSVGAIAGIVVGGVAALAAVALVGYYCIYVRGGAKAEDTQEWERDLQASTFRKYGLGEVQALTAGFSAERVLGEGGFAVVYRGVSRTGLVCAVKRHTRVLGDSFEKEVVRVSDLRHRNLIKLLGYCIEGGEHILIYEFAPHGSLHDLLRSAPDTQAPSAPLSEASSALEAGAVPPDSAVHPPPSSAEPAHSSATSSGVLSSAKSAEPAHSSATSSGVLSSAISSGELTFATSAEGAHLPATSAEPCATASSTEVAGAASALTVTQRLAVVRGSAEALMYLHSHGIIHRDIKPGNILLDLHLRPKLADFGIAKEVEGDVHAADVEAVYTGHVAGSRGYIDPEYYNEQRLSFKADVFSLGVVMLEVVTGRGAVVVADADLKLLSSAGGSPGAPSTMLQTQGAVGRKTQQQLAPNQGTEDWFRGMESQAKTGSTSMWEFLPPKMSTGSAGVPSALHLVEWVSKVRDSQGAPQYLSTVLDAHLAAREGALCRVRQAAEEGQWEEGSKALHSYIELALSCCGPSEDRPLLREMITQLTVIESQWESCLHST